MKAAAIGDAPGVAAPPPLDDPAPPPEPEPVMDDEPAPIEDDVPDDPTAAE